MRTTSQRSGGRFSSISQRSSKTITRALLFGAAAAASSIAADASADSSTASASRLSFYSNPMSITTGTGGVVQNCADPTVIHSQTPGDAYWYAYCTTDSLGDDDVDASGARQFHTIPTLRSLDLVNWQYVGDAFGASLPPWVTPGAGLWAPEVVYRNNKYYLYYTATDVADAVSGEPGCDSDNAIGVATSDSLAGPWVDSGGPVIAPRRGGPGCNFFWTYDPDVIEDDAGQAYLYYGSYYGGVQARPLSAEGLSAPEDAATQITIPNRYEGTEVVKKDGSYYLFASASNCCNGPLTGYQVFAGRSASPLGPFVDQNGVSMLDSHAGGTPAIVMNGNRWGGPGHNSVFQDLEGNWFSAYHAVNQNDPYFAGSVGYTKRALMLDRLTWDGGWPELRRGLGPSDTNQVAPYAQPARKSDTAQRAATNALLDATDPKAFLLSLDANSGRGTTLDAALSDDFNGDALGSQWSWVREPASGATVAGGAFLFDTQAADLFGGSNNASVLVEPSPAGNYIVETKVTSNVPYDGCCFNFIQGGIVVYQNDDAFLKLAQFSNWETRQVEFLKEIPDPLPGYPSDGSSVGAPPDATTWLRIAKVVKSGTENYVSYSSRDGSHWVRGATWQYALGAGAQLGLVSFGGSGFTSSFDYVHVYNLPNY